MFASILEEHEPDEIEVSEGLFVDLFVLLIYMNIDVLAPFLSYPIYVVYI
jgi:hypothetical protein